MVNIIDSSVWVALFLSFDTQHKKAKKLINEVKGSIIMPYYVLNEVVTVLTYKHSKEQGDNFLLYIEGNKDITLSEQAIAKEISFYKKLTAKISFTDATLIMLSHSIKNSTLITFDTQMNRLSKKLQKNS